MNAESNLARFKADPDKVRVSIQPQGNRGFYFIVISSRTEPSNYVQTNNVSANGIAEALEDLLKRAHGVIPGVDIMMQWARHHPQK